MIVLPDHDLKNGKLVKRKRHKFNATPMQVDNLEFPSQAEGNRYKVLKRREQAGKITDLELQPKFELQPGFTDSSGEKQRAIYYKADFAYQEDGKQIIEEVKGFETEAWKIKRKLFLYKYPQYVLRVVRK
jgi:hypothetical protein